MTKQEAIEAAASDMGFDNYDDMIEMLENHGLYIVNARDKTLLDAMSEVPFHCLNRQLQSNHRDEREAANAELARRLK